MARGDGHHPEDLEARTDQQSGKSSETRGGDHCFLCGQRQDKGTSSIIWILRKMVTDNWALSYTGLHQFLNF